MVVNFQIYYEENLINQLIFSRFLDNLDRLVTLFSNSSFIWGSYQSISLINRFITTSVGYNADYAHQYHLRWIICAINTISSQSQSAFDLSQSHLWKHFPTFRWGASTQHSRFPIQLLQSVDTKGAPLLFHKLINYPPSCWWLLMKGFSRSSWFVSAVDR